MFDLPKRERAKKFDGETVVGLSVMLGDLRAEQKRRESAGSGSVVFGILMPLFGMVRTNPMTGIIQEYFKERILKPVDKAVKERYGIVDEVAFNVAMEGLGKHFQRLG